MSDKVLPINEIYTCLQGEGKLTGVPHILIRVSGCRLRCQFANSFCDTPYSSWAPEKGKYSYEDIHEFYNKHKSIKHTMITGGGPTLHSGMLIALCELAKEFKLRGIPTTIFIDKEGFEIARVIGFLDFENKDFLDWLNNYL